MLDTKGYAAFDSSAPLRPFSFERRELRPSDVLIRIDYCGVCHSDLHQVRNEWKGSTYPMVPGHEIVGHVERVGSAVKKLAVGDLAGVGCMVDACRTCEACTKGLEQYCEGRTVFTYNSKDNDGATTQGGYSTQIVVDEAFALRVAKGQPLAGVAPLLCAGITMYSPIRHWGIGKSHRVAVVGLGGLGHMAVKLAAAFGSEVTLLSSSPSKKADAARLGAHDFIVTSEKGALDAVKGRFDFILDTVSAPHDLSLYAGLLKTDGVMILVGIPDQPAKLPAGALIGRRRSIAGSMIGGIAETQEMLDFCAEKGIVADVETIPIQDIDKAYDRMLKGDVRYRFVIDLKSLA
ncbi:MAG: NAD(P)-dependent alcohol dehydrogenase [Byssovorax sp.]